MRNITVKLLSALLLLSTMIACGVKQDEKEEVSEEQEKPKTEMGTRWTEEKANEWGAKQPWLVGANFNPSDASNQLDFWQADTWNPELIDKELGWAAEIGMNTMRVYLHYFPFRDDKENFLKRMDQFLEISDKHSIKPMFVFFDDVWYPNPRAGKQPDVLPHVHNSNWMQSPGAEILMNEARHNEVKPFVVETMTRFKDDDRVLLWDLYNEPQNTNNNSYGEMGKGKEQFSLSLLKKVFAWAREVNPSQPISSAPWLGGWVDENNMSDFDEFMFNNSDIITYHNYAGIEEFKRLSEPLKRYNRPLICTEYMARGNNSLFETHLPYMAENNIGAINWGFVAGRSQTIYPWDSWLKTYTAEPELWFHDIFRQDGTPYKQEDVDLIKKLTTEKNAK
ncbi:MAG: cellulase family glycosylhydrolase [Bacteroidota bacterium]